MTEHAEDHPGRVTVLHARGRDDHPQEIAQGVGEDVAFASLDLFACVVATALLSNGVGALYALAVDDRNLPNSAPRTITSSTRL